MGGTGAVPNGYPGQPIGNYNPGPYSGAPPWYRVGYPPVWGGPGIPVVMNPVPYPGTYPAPPSYPLPNPGTTPTIPIGLPTPAPTEPPDDSNEFWSPWPLPPRGNPVAVLGVGFGGEGAKGSMTPQGFRPSGVHGVGAGISANGARQQHYVAYASAATDEDLRYRGGRIIRNLSYVNLYVSGDTEWSAADVEQIDGSLSAAMRDEHLNNVLLQYYDNQPITSTALPSHPLVGYTPGTVTRGDIDNYVNHLHRQGFLRSFDLDNTVLNFLLPPGTVLTDRSSAANGQSAATNAQSFGPRTRFRTQTKLILGPALGVIMVLS